jgi:hypothetical protein
MAMEIGLHKWDLVAWSCFGGSLDMSIGDAFVILLVIESIGFQIVHWVFERYQAIQNLEWWRKGWHCGNARGWHEEFIYCICIKFSTVNCFYYLDKLKGPRECKNPWIPDVLGIGNWVIVMLECQHVMLEMIEDNHCWNYQAYWMWVVTNVARVSVPHTGL